MKKKLQDGFAHLGLLLLLIVIAVIAFVAYRVVNNSKNEPQTAGSTQTTQQPINSNEDLDSATSTLNNSNLDSDLDPSSLDQDVDSLL